VHLALLLAAFSADLSFCVVTLSNGESTEGKFSITDGKKLDLFDTKRQKRVQIDPDEVARITVTAEDEKIGQAWMFKEDGNRDKLKLPGKYPLRSLSTDITLTSGETLTGHIVAPFYVETEEESKRFFLVKDQKGEKDQTLEQLVYVKNIVLPNRKVGDGKLGTITVKAPGKPALFSIEREMTLDPPFTGLLAGHYDVFIFGDKKVRFGLTGDEVPEADRKAIQDKVDQIEEFYTHKKIVAFAKTGSIVRGFIDLTRPEESYDAGFKFERWELWTFEPTKTSWDIKRRLFIHRERFTDAQGLPKLEYVKDEKLKSVKENAVIE
jgi:hypothetical protein